MQPCPLLVFADDWGRHPSSCQHLVRRLLDRRAVTWVNTIGMRPPRLDLLTLKRGLGKVRQWLRPAPAAAPEAVGPRVLNPRMWPWFRSGFDRRINRMLLLRQLAPVVASLPEPPIAVTTLPIVADLMGRLPVRRWVYYCVDDFAQWPGLDRTPLQRMEEEVVAKADRIVTVSENLQERISSMGRKTDLLTHGVDLDFWSDPRIGEAPAELASLERPLIAFWGVTDRRPWTSTSCAGWQATSIAARSCLSVRKTTRIPHSTESRALFTCRPCPSSVCRPWLVRRRCWSCPTPTCR